MGAPTTLLLVRHGSTEWTAARRVCGSDDAGPALSEDGADEVRRLAKVLRSGAFGGLPEPVAVVASPLLRARQTADLLAADLGVEVSEDAGWAEVRFGAWHGLTYGQIQDTWGTELLAWTGSLSAAPPGGESLDDLVARVGAARERLVATHRGAAVVVVSHVGPLRATVSAALDGARAAFWQVRVSPASLSVVRCWDDGGMEVSALNLGGRVQGLPPAGPPIRPPAPSDSI
jgi:ribonuclease H / adenosylcobalamin/alpha-ribazole phosphatase